MAYRGSDSSSKEAFDLWNPLEQAIDKIYKRQHVDLSYMELYNKAYTLAINNFGDITYDNLKKCLTSYFKADAARISSEKSPNMFLSNLNKTWSDALEFLKSLTTVFDYLHSKFIPRSQLSPLTGLGYQMFKEIFLEEKVFCGDLQRHILDMIHNEREGNMVDRTLLLHTIRILRDLGTYYEYSRGVKAGFTPKPSGSRLKANAGAEDISKPVRSLEVYRTYFESKFLEATEKYCCEDAEQSAMKLSPLEYLKRVEERFQSEIERANFYLDVSSKPLLIEVFVYAYIISKVPNVVDTVKAGLSLLFDEGNRKDTKNILEMFNHHKLSRETFNENFFEYQKTRLETALSKDGSGEEKEQFGMVKRLIEHRKNCVKSLKLFNDCEGDASKVKGAAVDDIYEKHINANKKVVIELNSFLDYQFREGFKALKDPEVESILDDVMDIFKYIRDRDIFEKGYSFLLSKRLLTIKNLSQENEKLFMGKLRQECGVHFTNKMEIMFTDINVCKDLNTDYQVHIKNLNLETSNPLIQNDFPNCFDVKVLTLGNWPHIDQTAYTIPEEVLGWTASFGDYYAVKYPGRRLIWVMTAGTAELRSFVGGKKKEFLVSTIQMIVLLMFNSQKSVSVKEIHMRTKVSLKDLEHHLLGLLAVKLLKKENEDEMNENDSLTLNETFAHREYRVRVPLSKKKKDDEAQNMDKLAQKAEGERKLRVEACIVRVMKARRELKNNELLAEVMRMSNIYQFKPETKLIKAAIEGLIEKEYLKRDDKDKNVYHYIS